ncbi:MAG: ATP-binding cassette domain-containing protein [Thermus sp.]|uniref:ATP-binding cassette domain-containing protein n=1 Tax=Thermus sp. TaxID=275 RepID=UPI00351BE49D
MGVAELRQAVKRYGPVEALGGLDLCLERGEGLVLLGPNGAGKSTAIHLLVGLLVPDQGEVRLFGLEPRNPLARQRLGLTPQEAAFPERLRVQEVLALVAAHYPRPRALGEVLRAFGLEGLAPPLEPGAQGRPGVP